MSGEEKAKTSRSLCISVRRCQETFSNSLTHKDCGSRRERSRSQPYYRVRWNRYPARALERTHVDEGLEPESGKGELQHVPIPES